MSFLSFCKFSFDLCNKSGLSSTALYLHAIISGQILLFHFSILLEIQPFHVFAWAPRCGATCRKRYPITLLLDFALTSGIRYLWLLISSGSSHQSGVVRYLGSGWPFPQVNGFEHTQSYPYLTWGGVWDFCPNMREDVLKI